MSAFISRVRRTKVALVVAAFGFVASGPSVASGASDEQPKKPIFDATRFVQGQTASTGERVPVLDAHRVRFVYGFHVELHRHRADTTRAAVRNAARAWAEEPPILTVLNVEHIPVESVRRHRGVSDKEIQIGHDTLSKVIDSIREEAPGLRIGLFDMLPAQHMHAWNPTHNRHSTFMQAYRRAFHRVDPETGERSSYGLGDRLDFIAPAIYIHPARLDLYHRDKAAGRSDADNRGLNMIRRWIADTVAAARTADKPVYPVVWHRMHGGPNYDADGFERNEYIGDKLFRLVLEEVMANADGVIWWTRAERYTASDPWHAVMREFTSSPPATIDVPATSGR